MYARIAPVFLIAALQAGPVFGHGDSHAKKGAKKAAAAKAEETEFGRPGDARKATRTVTVGMKDSMHFTSGNIVVKQGETLKFVVGTDVAMESAGVTLVKGDLRGIARAALARAACD